MQKNFLHELLRMDQTVFSFKELILKFPTIKIRSLTSQLSYYVKNGDLYHIRRGLYAKDTHYNKLELATKILTPAYISFETVLQSAGVIFQHYSQTCIASYQSKEIICDGQTYSFRTITSTILTRHEGIDRHENYSIASPERAFLDSVYLHKHYHFDNLDRLDWDKVYEIVPIYGDNQAMAKRVKMYHNSCKQKPTSEYKTLKSKRSYHDN